MSSSSSTRSIGWRAGPLLAASALALSACASGPSSDKPGAEAAVTTTEQFTLQTTQRSDEIRLDPHPAGLSGAQVAALAALAGRWQDSGGGPIVIQTPATSDQQAARRAASESRILLLNAGVPFAMVRETSYAPAAGQPAAIVVGFVAREAVVPRCGTQWENISNTSTNKPMQNFGCAVTANMAAQIANPADIEGPRAVDPADAGRRAFVIDNYRQSKMTAGAKDSQSSGAVSAKGGGSSGGGSGG
jgi:pilus assembly protein CpaD